MTSLIYLVSSFLRRLRRRIFGVTEIEQEYNTLHTAYNVVYQPCTEMVSIPSFNHQNIIHEFIPSEVWITQNQILIDAIVDQTKTEEA